MNIRPTPAAGRLLSMLTLSLLMIGCAAPKPALRIEGRPGTFGAGTIVDVAQDAATDFDRMAADLGAARVIYVGEQHTSADHHAFQLEVIRALADRDPDLMVGMEMFDRTYQPVLDRWSQGGMTEAAFIRATHWYANWRFPYRLYRELLDFVRERRLALVGLNVPFCLPAKIAVGGIDSLRPDERRLLPREMDLSREDHRRYVRQVFKMHRIPGRDHFEDFYAAQCVWDEGMAETVADRLGGGQMVVLAGNGHIQRKYGIPERAYRRLPVPFKTVYQAPAGETVSPDVADYIRVSPPRKTRHR